jgi:hypothetical protein
LSLSPNPRIENNDNINFLTIIVGCVYQRTLQGNMYTITLLHKG